MAVEATESQIQNLYQDWEKQPCAPAGRTWEKRENIQEGETLESIAQEHGWHWPRLAEFNWGTRDPREVNFYLKKHLNCPETADHVNRRFKGGEWLWVPKAKVPEPAPPVPPEPPPAPEAPNTLPRGSKGGVINTPPEIVLGIEVEPTSAGHATAAEINLGQPGSGDDPLQGFRVQIRWQTAELQHDGKRYLKAVPCGLLAKRTARVRAAKAKTLRAGSGFDEKSGQTEFDQRCACTEEQLAEIYVFRETQCLTGNAANPGEVRSKMGTTRPGLNRILVCLDAGGKIKECLIDGVTHWENQKERVPTAPDPKRP